VSRARDAGVSRQLASSLSDAEVEARIFKQLGRHEPQMRAPVDFEWVHRELRRTGVTHSFSGSSISTPRRAVPMGRGRISTASSAICTPRGDRRLAVSMRQVHRAGEKAFVDYSGKKPASWTPQRANCAGSRARRSNVPPVSYCTSTTSMSAPRRTETAFVSQRQYERVSILTQHVTTKRCCSSSRRLGPHVPLAARAR
jgi:hypothetical protein